MGRGSNMGGGLSYQQLRDAVLEALNLGGSGGGGGSSVLVPDLIVTGSGPSAYVIPAGFNAIVNVTQGFEDFNVNGSPIIEASGREEDTNITATGSGHVNNTTIYTSKNPFEMRVTGTVQCFGSGPGFQISGGGAGIYVGPTLIGSMPSHPTASGIIFSYSNLPLLLNETIRTQAVVTWVNPPASLPTFVNSGFGITGPTSSASMKMELPEGTTISGGRYVVELFAI